jgi:copper chaperone CopZ
MLVKEEVGEIPGVRGVEASHREGTVKITHEDSADLSRVKSKIRGLGYKVVENG